MTMMLQNHPRFEKLTRVVVTILIEVIDDNIFNVGVDVELDFILLDRINDQLSDAP